MTRIVGSLAVALLAVSAAQAQDPGPGVIAGSVTDSSGLPIRSARAMTGGLETRTDSAGLFVLRNVPVGARQVSIVSLGHSPASVVVQVTASDTAFVTAVLGSIQLLDAVRIAARTPYAHHVALGIEERKRLGLGYVVDSTRIRAHGTLASVFASAPSVRMRGSGARFVVMFPVRVQRLPGEELCAASVWIDGRSSDHSFLNELRPEEIAVVEVYSRFLVIPVEYMGRYTGCGVVAVWTKRALQ